MTDVEIIRLIILGEKEKFRLLMEKYQPLVFRTCLGFVHNKDDADDLTQEVFIQAYQSLSSFKGEAAFSTWLYRIAVNASLNRIRQSRIKSILQYFKSFSGGEKDPQLFTVNTTCKLFPCEHFKPFLIYSLCAPETQKYHFASHCFIVNFFTPGLW